MGKRRYSNKEREPDRTPVENLFGVFALSPSNTVGWTLILNHMRGEFIIRQQSQRVIRAASKHANANVSKSE